MNSSTLLKVLEMKDAGASNAEIAAWVKEQDLLSRPSSRERIVVGSETAYAILDASKAWFSTVKDICAQAGTPFVVRVEATERTESTPFTFLSLGLGTNDMKGLIYDANSDSIRKRINQDDENACRALVHGKREREKEEKGSRVKSNTKIG